MMMMLMMHTFSCDLLKYYIIHGLRVIHCQQLAFIHAAGHCKYKPISRGLRGSVPKLKETLRL